VKSAKISMFYVRHWNNVYNWHFRWPETNAVSLTDTPANEDTRKFGRIGVNLESALTRFMDTDFSEQSGLTVDISEDELSLHDLVKSQALLKGHQRRDWLTGERYQEILQTLFRSKGSAEPDKVPTLLSEYSQWLAGEEIWATDASNLGAVAGLMQIKIDWQLPFRYVAPEHMLFSYHLVMRVPPVFENARSPWLDQSKFSHAERVCEAPAIGAAPPYQVDKSRYLTDGSGDATMGWQPAGQMWRVGWNQVDAEFDVADGHMIYHGDTLSQHQLRYCKPVDGAFVSTKYGNALGRLDFRQMVRSAVPEPVSSVLAGT